MVYGIGINDMEYGWTKANEWNHRVYQVWQDMLRRCYSEKEHERHPTYIGCVVCERWLKLSNFVEDIVKIDNYEYWRDNPNQRISLDKDIKSNGISKCYCLEQCQFISKSENSKQAMKTRDYDDIKGEKNPMFGRTGEKNPMFGKTGEKHPMYGKHHSEETRQKLSEINKGKYKGENNPRARKVVMIDEPTKQTVFTFKYKKQAIDFYYIGGRTLDYYLKGKSRKGHEYNGFLWYYADEYEQMKEDE